MQTTLGDATVREDLIISNVFENYKEAAIVPLGQRIEETVVRVTGHGAGGLDNPVSRAVNFSQFAQPTFMSSVSKVITRVTPRLACGE